MRLPERRTTTISGVGWRSWRLWMFEMLSARNYLEDRCIIYQTTQGHCKCKVTSGVAQGSILGNALCDGLLKTSMPENVTLVGCADNVTLLITAQDVELIQLKLNQVLRRVDRWLETHGLSLTLEKTEIVILAKKRILTIIGNKN